MNYIYVMIGGALGALSRYSIGQLLSNYRFFSMPIATICVNLVGCFLLGIFSALAIKQTTLPILNQSQSQALLLLLSVGFCGAFTTFSTFSSESIKAMEAGLIWQPLLYLLISVGGGFLLFWLGKNLIS